ncbi:short-chain alcohol dehydrogenase [Hypoxylon texense]
MSGSIGQLTFNSFSKDTQAALDALGALEKLSITVGLVEQVDDLLDIARCFDDLATTERRNPSVPLKFYSANDLILLQKIVASTEDVLRECHPLVRRIRDSVDEIVIERQQGAYATTEVPPDNQALFDEMHSDLRLRTETLKALFMAISLLNSQHVASEDAQSIEARSRTSTQLHYQIGVVEKELGHGGRQDTYDVYLKPFNTFMHCNVDVHLLTQFYQVQIAVATARAVTVSIPAFPNKHFVISRPIRDYFTGRKAQLSVLDAAFNDPMQATQQRFVIYGLSGSGKTELAFKYADRARNKFWGVFFVDGSSRKNAASSYADIATLGGAEPNEKAGKNWLMICAYPWLLIIDNVDEEEVDVDQLLPPGAKGCILITTRNPRLTAYGNAGASSLELLVMEPNEAEVLLTQAAEEPRPLTKLLADSASSICQALGYLPLALVQAAKAILTDICKWPEYLTFWDRQMKRIRRTKHALHRSRSRSGDWERADNDDNSINVFSTYEVLYESLELSPKQKCKDAVELLHVFSFFHFQNIRLDVLISAAVNPLKEEAQQRKDEEREKELYGKLATPPRKPWLMFLRELREFVDGKFSTPAPLPNVLRNRDGLNLSELEVEVKDRLRYALSVLVERSLVTRQDRATNRYTMHRLVHKWVRERPEMSTSHQALWCQVSLTTLASSIRRPPHDDTHARRELLPHISHASECQAMLEEALEENVKRDRPIFRVKKSYGRLQAEQDVRFSRVYAETGHRETALRLQKRALEYVSKRLGPDHPLAIQLLLLASLTLGEMSKMGKATQKLRDAHRLCVSTWGEDHPLTLDVTDLLGSALQMRGLWGEATDLHTANVEKTMKLYGINHEKTLKSMRNLGRLQHRHMNFDESTRLRRIAWEGMREILGPTHLETLTSLEDLSTSYIRYEEENPDPDIEKHLAESHENLVFVWEERKKQLGEENAYTLLASIYLAQLKSTMGNYKEAEAIIRSGLTVIVRNFGEDHLGVTMVRSLLAEVLAGMGRFEEAESILYFLAERARYTHITDEEGDHPDRISNLYRLCKCLEKQGKFEEELKICEEFIEGLTAINGNGNGPKHKMMSIMKKRRVYLMEKMQQNGRGAETGEGRLIDI